MASNSLHFHFKLFKDFCVRSKTTTKMSTADLALLSQTEINEFKIGMAVEVDYVNPNAGWTVIWLQDAEENVVLTFSARINERELVLNTRTGGNWGTEVRPQGYDFTPGVEQHVSLQAEQDHFIILVNNTDLLHFNYRLPPTSIKRVVVQSSKSSGPGTAAPTKLKAVTYKY